MTGNEADHSHCVAARITWRRRFSIALMICILMLAVAVYQTIIWQRAKAISNYKTAIVAAEAASVSNIATILMDETGIILKSNYPADDMLSSGENAEGKNIHDFCVNVAEREKALNGMKTWYRGAPVGSVKALTVVMRLPIGDVPMVVIATSIKPGAAGDIAFKADLIYSSQFTYSNIVHNQPRPSPQ